MLKLGFVLFALLVSTSAHATCELEMPPIHSGAPAPLAEGFTTVNQASTTPRGGLTLGFDAAYSVERVLQRRQRDECRQAIIVALTPVHIPLPARPDYIKQTEFDNTPYRFNMTQNGKQMTADDFDAWLKSNGYSVGRKVKPEAIQED